MRKTLIAGLLTLLVALAAAGCGSSSSSSSSGGSQSAGTQSSATTSNTHLAKTKFVLHAGLAFGAFHRYIYKPFKAGKFSGSPLHHKAALAKGALAAAFAFHEVRLALQAAHGSPTLSKVLAPLDALRARLASLKNGLHGGRVDPAAIQSANSDTTLARAESGQAGQPIQDLPTPSLGG